MAFSFKNCWDDPRHLHPFQLGAMGNLTLWTEQSQITNENSKIAAEKSLTYVNCGKLICKKHSKELFRAWPNDTNKLKHLGLLLIKKKTCAGVTEKPRLKVSQQNGYRLNRLTAKRKVILKETKNRNKMDTQLRKAREPGRTWRDDVEDVGSPSKHTTATNT